MVSGTKLSHQEVGAFGERSVEAELLRHGWVPANVNQTVKNAKDFDIFAFKKNNDRSIQLRVKTCGPGLQQFQFGGFKPGVAVPSDNFGRSDFTILVSMATHRGQDQFYVVPSREVRQEIALRQKEWTSKSRRDGSPRKDLGFWTLRLKKRQDGLPVDGYDLAEKWKKYLDAWHLLEGKTRP